MDFASAYAMQVYAAHGYAAQAAAADVRSVRPVGTRSAPARAKLGADPNFRWYRTPIFWLALALFVASLAGCIVTIMLALGQPDGALPDVGERLLSVPTAHAGYTR